MPSSALSVCAQLSAFLAASGVATLMCSKLRCYCRRSEEGRCACGAGFINEGVSIIPGEKIAPGGCCAAWSTCMCGALQKVKELFGKE